MDDLLANRLNYDPVMYKGLTRNEMLMLAGICLPISLVLFGFIFTILLNNLMWGIAAGFGLGCLITFGSCGLFYRLIRGHEKGYLNQKVMFFMEDKGLGKKPVTRRSGYWFIEKEI